MPDRTYEWDYPADDSLLEQAQEAVSAALEQNDVPAKVCMQFSVCLEEMFVNVCHYAYPDRKGQLSVRLQVFDGRAAITLTDSGIPFDPLNAPEPDLSLPAESRPIGGLGIFMTRKLMDRVDYRREEDKNVLLMEKQWA